MQRLEAFIQTVLFPAIPQNLVIFIDEIDSILSLNFPMDDFFAFIRANYNDRADQPGQRRLTFALLGVAAPADLIRDKSRTPFNIGRAIQLTGFELPAALPLAEGLAPKTCHAPALLETILTWTGGQPFLTQKLCKLVLSTPDPVPTDAIPAWVEALVRSQVLENWEAQDEPEHLKTIRNRLLRNEQRTGRLLGLYQQILQTPGGIAADDSAEHMELRLSGLVVLNQNRLSVYNPIYAAVFNLAWVEKELANLRPYTAMFQAWIASGSQDESRLLRGHALQEALTWAASKSLSDQDYQFLTASQDQEKREVQRSLEAEIQAKQAIAKANQILTQAQQQAQRILRRAFLGLGVVSFISVGAIAIGVETHRALRESRQSLTLEQVGVATLEQFPKAEIPALLTAIESGQKLRSLVGQQRPLQDYPTVKPLFVLRTILDQIHEYHQWNGHQGKIYSGSFSPDGQRLATAGTDGTVRLWSLGGQALGQFSADPHGLMFVNFTPDAQRLLTVGSRGRVQLWRVSGQLLHQFQEDAGQIHSLRLSGDGQHFAIAATGGIVQVWTLDGQHQATLWADATQVNSLSFSPTGQQLATVGDQGIIRLWTLSGELLASWQGSSDQQSLDSISFAPNGQALVSVGEDGMIRFWNLSGQPLNQWRGSQAPLYSVSFSPRGQQLITLGEDSTIRLWNLSGQQLAELKGHEGLIGSASFSPNGQYLLTTGMDGTIRLWDLARQPQQWQGQQDSLWGVAFAPDGQQLATAGKDGTIRLWTRSGTLLHSFKAHDRGVNSISFSRDGEQLASAGQDGKIRLWTTAGQQIAQFSLDTAEVYSVSFSPDHRWLGQPGSMVLSSCGTSATRRRLPWQGPKAHLESAVSSPEPGVGSGWQRWPGLSVERYRGASENFCGPPRLVNQPQFYGQWPPIDHRWSGWHRQSLGSLRAAAATVP